MQLRVQWAVLMRIKYEDYLAETNLPGNVKLKDGRTALKAWPEEENPMLAQREYMKAEAKRVANMPDNTSNTIPAPPLRGEDAWNSRTANPIWSWKSHFKSATEYGYFYLC